MNDLMEFFHKGDHRGSRKHEHYFEIYERHFSKFRGKPVRVMEVGIEHGGSLQMWKHYFGEQAEIIGVDIDTACKDVEEDRIKVILGDQSSFKFWKQVKSEIPKIDILIDDGGHQMKQQITTLKSMFAHLNHGGVYMCEDIATSYQQDGPTFMDHCKHIIDLMNGWYCRNVKPITRTAYSMHFYPNVVVIEKNKRERPKACLSPQWEEKC